MDSPDDLQGLSPVSASGEPAAFERLLPQVYGELRRIAHHLLGRRRSGHTLDTTALVNEAYLRLAAADNQYLDRGHFFAVCARAMRHVLVDASRRRQALKRGGPRDPATLDDEELAVDAEAERILGIEQALERLAGLDSRLTRVVECRVFAGYTEAETAQALEIPLRTVQRLWLRARAWLAVELAP